MDRFIYPRLVFFLIFSTYRPLDDGIWHSCKAGVRGAVFVFTLPPSSVTC